MGRFDIERLLRELGDPAEDAPREPGSAGHRSEGERYGLHEIHSPADTLGSDSATSPSSDPVADAAGKEASGPVPAVRPDFRTGDGLGMEVDPTLAISDDHVRPTRPDDALRDLFVPDPNSTGSDETGPMDIAVAMLRAGTLDEGQVETAHRLHEQSGGKSMSAVLLDMGIAEDAVQAAVAEQARIPFLRIEVDAVDQESLQRLGSDFCRERLVVPIRSEGARTIVGTTVPDDVFLLDDVKRRLGISVVRHVLVCASEIEFAIQTIESGGEGGVSDVDAILADVDEDDVEFEKQDDESTDLEAEAESSPVVRYVNHIIQSALKEGASDIHIEPGENTLKVRLRIDGILFEMMTPPRKMHGALTSRIKIMANLDIAERRLPQDGRIRATVMDRKLDLRVSTVPTAQGEKTVMRILDDRAIQVSLDELGFADDTLLIWKKQIEQPHGIILVTGPTGSGKTTTLYSSLRQMDLRRLNVSTVEDPVEYALEGVTQIQTHNAIDMTFARALKALLRQDPDVVMVGEIRDHETASIAVQAALTGHLVLSTLHTNDAPSSITRLINIGVEPFLVGAALNGVLAQRLVRRICPDCTQDTPVPQDMGEFLEVHGIHASTLPQGVGCDSCRKTGYSGRLGLYELLVLDDHLRDLIASNPNITEFRRICCERGMVTLREDGFRKVSEGRTTVEEVLRVTEATI